MAAAGVDYHVGREANSVYGEEWNGVQTGVLHHGHHFGVLKKADQPLRGAGRSEKRRAAPHQHRAAGRTGEGDNRVQAYCFRMCLTERSDNRIPFPKPEGYDPASTNCCCASSTPAGARPSTSSTRSRTKDRHQQPRPVQHRQHRLQLRLPRGQLRAPPRDHRRARDLPEGLAVLHRQRSARAADVQRGDARVGPAEGRVHRQRQLAAPALHPRGAAHDRHFVMTENELRKKKPTPDSVGMGSYTIDSHNVQRYITPDGYVQNEGDIGVSTNGPTRSPTARSCRKRASADNLLVPGVRLVSATSPSARSAWSRCS
jgi:hypothetical protein